MHERQFLEVPTDNARAAALIPQMVTLIRTLSRASEDNFQWMVDEAKRLAAELD